MRKNIPNSITCLNLGVGVVGLYYVFMLKVEIAIFFVVASAMLDFTDGFVAKMLHAQSELGKQLDSLADLVSFGVLPSVFMILWIDHPILKFSGALIAVFSAIRLARFNLDAAQQHGFLGLPTPANAIMICSLAYLSFDLSDLLKVAVVILSCIIMVARVPMLSLKMTHYRWKKNESRWVLIFSSLLFLIVFGMTFIPFLIPLYLVVSLVTLLIDKKILIEA